ncbi:MAG: NADH-quinone oxidoreductase subunit NuoF [Deltaproteobacteria bacterium]|nr:NADH-quinone oxidoreductase subunit NuoF [Deltaproteobacteria bacterium]
MNLKPLTKIFNDERCTHKIETPCRHLLTCLNEGPVCYKSDDSIKNVENWKSETLRTATQKPLIIVGSGTCGLGAGSQSSYDKIKEYLEANNIDAELAKTGCIGLCAKEPIVDIQLPGKNRISFGMVTEKRVENLLESVLAGTLPKKGVEILYQHRNDNESFADVPFIDEHPFFKFQKRAVLLNCGVNDPVSIADYIARGGYASLSKILHSKTRDEVCDDVEKSGLRGRGGGGFLAGKKWKFAKNTAADQKYMICNADEGDPGAFMDRAVIEGDPHSLLEGLSIAAYAIGASVAYIYIRAEYPLAIKHLNIAIEDSKANGLLGSNILDSGVNLEIKIKKGAGAFVCGEETALINSIEGKRGMPRPRPPFPAVSGLFGKPTIINNVETLANLPGIFRNGVEVFAKSGTATSKGTKVFALSGKVENTGLVEVEMGTTMRKIVFDIGGGIPFNNEFKAVQIGGPSGGCIPLSHLDTEVDYESIKELGAMMGSGGLVVMDNKTCMVDVAKFFMDFIQSESCGKCIPCREGTKRMLEILERITKGRESESNIDALDRFKGITEIEKLSKVIQSTSLCGLGQTAPNPVLSTLKWFKNEYEEHVFERKCRAGVCRELVKYEINSDACTGCMLCMKKCPVDAIMGAKKTAHYIIEDKCIKCGVCFDVCKQNAVKVA